MGRRMWTEEEISLLRELYPNYSVSDPAFDELKRTKSASAIRAMACKLSIRSPRTSPDRKKALADPVIEEALRRVSWKHDWSETMIRRVYLTLWRLERATGKSLQEIIQVMSEVRHTAISLKKAERK